VKALGLGLALALGAADIAAAQNRTTQPAQPPAQAAPAGATANPFGAGGTGPLRIDSDRLEVRDREKQAIFSGNVVAVRGEAMLRASVMTVYYEGEARPGGAAPAPAAQQGQQIRRIVMQGPVFFCQRDQMARGDNAEYDRVNERLVMRGNVVLTQGANTITGPRLVVNLRTSQAEVQREGDQRVVSQLQQGPSPAQAPPAPQRPARPGQPAPQRPC
jgi:lipopolysaccharide export system protein LptA